MGEKDRYTGVEEPWARSVRRRAAGRAGPGRGGAGVAAVGSAEGAGSGQGERESPGLAPFARQG